MKNTSSDGPFVSMCCKPDTLYPPESICYRNGSFPVEKIMFPEIYDSHFSISAMKPSEFVHRYGFSCNGTTYDLESYPPKNDLYLLMDIGWIYVNKSIDGGIGYWLSTDNYCLASYVTENGTRTVVSVCRSLVKSHAAANRMQFMIDLIGLSISIPFLIATFLVYTILPELRNLHGSIFRCYIASIFVFNLIYALNFAGARFTCIYYIVIVAHFSVLSTFFWMQVLCFNIWWTFRQFRSVQHISKGANKKKFIIYSMYAWGCSALIPGVGAIIDSVPTVPNGIIRPGIRGGHCGMPRSPKIVLAIYVYIPMAFTIISNACFIVLTAIKIIRHGRDTAHHFGGIDNQRHNDAKQRFHRYVKLFIFMGITWSIDFFTWQVTSLPGYVLAILDLPNLLQGFIIFVIFICKDNIKQMLLKRLGCKGMRFHLGNKIDSAYRGSSLQTSQTEPNTDETQL